MKKIFLLLILCILCMTFSSILFAGDFAIKNGVLLKYKGNAKNLVIPNGVKTIDERAFKYHSVKMPDGSWSDNLYSAVTITIPASVTNISCDFSFHIGHGCCESYGFNKLEAINVSEDNKYYSSVNGVLFNKNKTKLICYPSNKKGNSYRIPDTVTYISGGSFTACQLKEITIPKNVKRLGSTAFDDFEIGKLTIENPTIWFGDENSDSFCVFANSVYLGKTILNIPYELREYFIDPYDENGDYNCFSCLGYYG